MHRRLLFTIAFTGMAMSLAATAWAQAPGDAPPVRQELGFTDTVLANADAADCRICHAQTANADRHHVLAAGQQIPTGTVIPFPDTDGDGEDDQFYGCLSCHGYDGTWNTGQIALVRNCLACHQASPHHRTEDATNRNCKACHGDLVDNYDDGHYIPTYAPSLVTPFTGLHGDGYYEDGDPETMNLGTGVLDIVVGDYPGTAGTGDTHASDANRLGLVLESTGQDNDIVVDSSGRYDDGSFIVTVIHGTPVSAVWSADGSTDYGKLTITFENGVTTAGDLVDAIDAATGTPVENKLVAELSTAQGEGSGMFGDTHYEPMGGLPLNKEGFGAGSCSYCHDADPDGGVVVDNHDTHHNIELGIGTGSDVKAGTPGDPNPGGTWRKCNACHDYTTAPRGGTYHDNGGATFALHIRICEECHGPDSLHSIQGDSNGGGVVVGGEASGYGHVGRDAMMEDPENAGQFIKDSDCWGCHGFEVPSGAMLLAASPVVPTLYNLDEASISAGTDSTVLLSGLGFLSVAGGDVHQSSVSLTAADGSSVTLTADAITETSLAVTIPANIAAGNYQVRAVAGADCASNPIALAIMPAVKIDSVKAEGAVVAITGSGFATFGEGLGTSVTSGDVEALILSWTKTEIVAEFPATPQVVSVSSVFGKASAAVKQPAKPAANEGEPEQFRAAADEDKVFSLGR